MTRINRNLYKQDPEEWQRQKVSRIRIEGGFSEEYSFWLSDSDKNRRRRYYWKFTCPKCSSDEYVKAGLCDGVFECAENVLFRGQLSCRCSKVYRWTEQQRLYCINKFIEQNSLGFIFVKWDPKYVNSGSAFFLKCEKHTPWRTEHCRLVLGFGCPHCAKSGFKSEDPGVFYVIRAHNEFTDQSFVGYGITGNLDRRISVHRRKLRNKGYRIVEMEYFNFESGSKALAMERFVKKKFERLSVNVEGFRTEATFSHNYYEILACVGEVVD